jgi:hypothetical protein
MLVTPFLKGSITVLDASARHHLTEPLCEVVIFIVFVLLLVLSCKKGRDTFSPTGRAVEKRGAPAI